jgi:predicted transcriptional regulator
MEDKIPISMHGGKEQFAARFKSGQDDLTSLMKYIMMLFYAKKEISNTLNLAGLLDMTYSHVFKYMEALLAIGFLEKTKLHRTNTYKITPDGEKYCELMLKRV